MKPIPHFRGPSLILLAIVHLLLFVSNLTVAAALGHGASYVNPFAAAEAVRAFFAQNTSATRSSSFFLFGSAVPFGIFAVTTVSWLRFLKVRAAGVNIAFFGGLTATFALMLSGLSGWIVSLPDIAASAPLAKAIYSSASCLVEWLMRWDSACWPPAYPLPATSPVSFHAGWLRWG